MHAQKLSMGANTCADTKKAAGPEPLEDYFSSKSGTKYLVRHYQVKFGKNASEHLKVCHIWLIKLQKTHV